MAGGSREGGERETGVLHPSRQETVEGCANGSAKLRARVCCNDAGIPGQVEQASRAAGNKELRLQRHSRQFPRIRPCKGGTPSVFQVHLGDTHALQGKH